jgi:hypothetical protein
MKDKAVLWLIPELTLKIKATAYLNSSFFSLLPAKYDVLRKY